MVEISTRDHLFLLFLMFCLAKGNFKCMTIHGDRQQSERETALRLFHNGTTPILIATDVVARGIDIPRVDVVINYDAPQQIDDYVHRYDISCIVVVIFIFSSRIGRTGRIGHRGVSMTFVDPNYDIAMAEKYVQQVKRAKQTPPEWLVKMSEDGDQFASAGSGAFNDDNRGLSKPSATASDAVADDW